MAHYEQYEAFEEICREGLAYLSRFTGGLEPEDQSTPLASTNSTPTIMEGDQDAGTTDDETSSSSSEDGAESVASSFMDEEEYLTITDPFTALFWELYRLAPRINRNELEEILFLIPLFLPQEIVLSHFLVRVKCNCPRTGQDTSRCLRCHKNICPSCSYNILDQCKTRQEISSDGRDGNCWERSSSLAAKRVRALCDGEYSDCLENLQVEAEVCNCAAFFMNPDRTCRVGQYCGNCIGPVISSLHARNSVKKTYNNVSSDFEVFPVGTYSQYQCDCGNESDELFYCRLCFRKCNPYALNRRVAYDGGPVPDSIEQGSRNEEEEKLWNTAECPYFFFPKQEYYLVTVENKSNGGMEESGVAAQLNVDEQGDLEEHGLREGLLIDFESRDEEHCEDLRGMT